MTTTPLILNILLGTPVFIVIVGGCLWAIISTRSPVPSPRPPASRRPRRTTTGRLPARRPHDVPAR